MNHAQAAWASTHDWALAIGHDDREWFVAVRPDETTPATTTVPLDDGGTAPAAVFDDFKALRTWAGY